MCMKTKSGGDCRIVISVLCSVGVGVYVCVYVCMCVCVCVTEVWLGVSL